MSLVETDWLEKNLDNVKIIDCSWHMPQTKRNGFEEYKVRHVPNAIFFDLDDNSKKDTKLPHMLVDKNNWEKIVSKMGIKKEDKIIIYDNSPLLSSARAWFLFRYYGHENIFILNGGLKNWKKSGGEITNKKTVILKSDFQSKTEKKDLVVDLNQMISVSNDNSKLILDARSYKRFTGEAKEPRPGLLSGHIPNSKSLTSSDLVTSDGFLKSVEELEKIFASNNINKSEQIIATCGSGVSACVITVALHCLGKKNVPIYDGSWTEWASSGQKIQTSS